MPSVSILLIISIKATRPHEGSLRAERIINPGAEYFCVQGWNFCCHTCFTNKHAPHDSFSEIMIQIVRNILLLCQFIRNIGFQFVSI